MNNLSLQSSPAATISPSVEDRLQRLTRELYQNLGPELMEEWQNSFPSSSPPQLPLPPPPPPPPSPATPVACQPVQIVETRQEQSECTMNTAPTPKLSAREVALNRWEGRIHPTTSAQPLNFSMPRGKDIRSGKKTLTQKPRKSTRKDMGKRKDARVHNRIARTKTKEREDRMRR